MPRLPKEPDTRKKPISKPSIPASVQDSTSETLEDLEDLEALNSDHPLDHPDFITNKHKPSHNRSSYRKNKPATRPGIPVPQGPGSRGLAQEGPQESEQRDYAVPDLGDTKSGNSVMPVVFASVVAVAVVAVFLLMPKGEDATEAATATQAAPSPTAGTTVTSFVSDLPGRDSGSINLASTIDPKRLSLVVDFTGPAESDFGSMANLGLLINPALPYFGERGQGAIKDSFLTDGSGNAVFTPDPSAGSFRSIDIPDVREGTAYLRWDVSGWEFANDNVDNSFSWGFRSANGKELLVDIAALEQTSPDICRMRVNNVGRYATIGDNLGLSNTKRFSIVLALNMTDRTYSVLVGDGLSKKYIRTIVDAKIDSSFDTATHIRFSAFGNSADDRVKQSLLAYGEDLEAILAL